MKLTTLCTLVTFVFTLVICSSAYEHSTAEANAKEIGSDTGKKRELCHEPCDNTPPLPGSPDYDSPMCGAQAGDAICPDNYCCSSHGFCGLSSAYCGAGCQNGPCEGEDAKFNYNYCT